MRESSDGHEWPPGGVIHSVLDAGVLNIPPGVDIRKEDNPLQRPTPMGPTFVIDVQEILKRGFKTLDEDERAAVIASYLSTQKQQLSPYMTPFDEELARNKMHIESNNHQTSSTMRRVGLWLAVFAVIGIIVMVINASVSKGVLSDSGNIQGFMGVAQEILRVVISAGSPS